MIPAPQFGEATRVSALRALNLLDTAPEERFDRVTRLARKLFGVQTALVSLVDDKRQWFKSAQNAATRETPRDVSFCGHALIAKTPLVVRDASLDERFWDNPLVTGDPCIRFYAGCPIATPEGHRVGTLCVIDDKPRDISGEERISLEALAKMVEADLTAFNANTSDPLTGLSNRRGFLEVGRYLLGHCQRNKLALQLVRIQVKLHAHATDLVARASLAELAPALLRAILRAPAQRALPGSHRSE